VVLELEDLEPSTCRFWIGFERMVSVRPLVLGISEDA